MKNNTFIVKENGKDKEYKIIKIFESKIFKSKYIIYTDNNVDYYASKYIIQSNNVILNEINNSEEWDLIDKELNKVGDNNDI